MVIAESGGAPIRGGGCLVYDKSVTDDYVLEGRVGKGGQATIAKGRRKPQPGEEPDPTPYAIKRFTVNGKEAEEKLLEEKAVPNLTHILTLIPTSTRIGRRSQSFATRM